MTHNQSMTPEQTQLPTMDTSIAVKICGIGSPADYDVCRDVGAAFVGMVFYPRSPRHLDLDTARALTDHAEQTAQMGAGPSRVALTVDMDDDGIANVIDAARPHYIQLHGHETPERASRIRDRFDLPLIRAIRVAGPKDLEVCESWEGVASGFYSTPRATPAGCPAAPAMSLTGRCWPTMPARQNGCLPVACRRIMWRGPSR